jgi:hypothetical protein
MDLEKLQKALELAKASLNTKKIKKLDTDKLEHDAEKELQNADYVNGKNAEQINWNGGKKLDSEIDHRIIKKDESGDLDSRIKAKKKEFQVSEAKKFPDPFKTNLNVAAKSIKVKKEETVDSETASTNMASPEHPKGLESKRKPVTHDDCGRPFAKDEDDIGEPDKETKNFLDHWEPPTKHPKEPTAGMPSGKLKGQRTTSTGFKMKLIKALSDAGHHQSALLLKNWDEMDSIAKATAEHIEKSNYGPKDMKLYNPIDNIKRKSTRTGEEVEGVGRNKGVRQYTSSGSAIQQAHEAAQAKEQHEKTKASTKIYTNEEKKALTEQYKKEGKI